VGRSVKKKWNDSEVATRGGTDDLIPGKRRRGVLTKGEKRRPLLFRALSSLKHLGGRGKFNIICNNKDSPYKDQVSNEQYKKEENLLETESAGHVSLPKDIRRNWSQKKEAKP